MPLTNVLALVISALGQKLAEKVMLFRVPPKIVAFRSKIRRPRGMTRSRVCFIAGTPEQIVKDSREIRSLIICACMLVGTSLCFAKPAAQDSLPPSQPPAIGQRSSQTAGQDTSANTPTEPKPEPRSEEQEKSEEQETKAHGGSFVIAPLPIVSPALGAGIIPVLGYIFPLEMKNASSPPSVVGAGGLTTDNGTRGFGLGTDLYLDQARYELKALYVHGNLDYNLYGVGFDNGNKGLKLPLEQAGQAFFVKFLRDIGWHIYVGGRFFTGSSFITVKPASGDLPPIPPDVGITTNLRALGVEVYRDSRANRFYPLQGSVVDFTGDFFMQGLGSRYSFQSYKFTFNKYWSLSDKQVLAYNLYWCGTGGSPPFYGNCIYGMSEELRGYTAGRYLDRYMLATQLEYRLALPWRFGAVGFGGIGGVAPGADQWRINQFLPAGGVGARYMLSKKYHVNLRADFAWGKDNFTWGVGVGEAF